VNTGTAENTGAGGAARIGRSAADAAEAASPTAAVPARRVIKYFLMIPILCARNNGDINGYS
jgi:hypothetical protein